MDVCRYVKTKGVHTSLQNPLSEEKRRSLLAFYAITGSDTTSQFYGVGKASAWKVFEDAPDLLEHLGEESQISADGLCLQTLRSRNTKGGNRQGKSCRVSQIQDALILHIKRWKTIRPWC